MKSRRSSLAQNALIVLRNLGLLVQVVGLMALLSLPVALFFREKEAIGPLLITAGITFSLGSGAFWGCRRAGEPTLAHGMVISALGWLIIPLFGALPIYLISLSLAQAQGPEAAQTILHFTSPLNAFFEGVSGYTGTGLTMALRPEELPRTLQWWRSFMQWIGGVGVILFMLALVTGPGAHTLYYAEARQEKIYPSIRSTVRTIWWIFLLYTAGSILLFWAVGMPPWDALNHGMTALATGGFSTYSDSIGHYNSVRIELAAILVMVLGALSFAVHHQFLRDRKFNAFFEDPQSRWLLILIVSGVILLALEALLRLPVALAFRRAAFQFTSALCTAGLQSVNSAELKGTSETGKLLLALAMVLGAAAGSTGGGLKVIRVITLACGVRWHLRRLVSPRDILVPFRLGGHSFRDEEAYARLTEAGILFILWWLFLGLGVVVLLHVAPGDFSLGDIIFEVASAQGNVGLSTGLTGPELPAAGKLMLCFNMWLGRLEIIPILLFLRAVFRGLD